MNSSYVIGVDYGTDSVRSVIIDTSNGEELATSVFYYPRWKEGLYCNAAKNQYRQHPLDYIEGLISTIRDCLKQVGADIRASIRSIGIDTTGSTPCPVDERGAPLALRKEFEDNPNAMFILWKDHTALEEASAINHTAAQFSTNYLQYVGGTYSSEWLWAKILHITRKDETVKNHAYTWMEHSDWMPFLLTDKTIDELKRNICAAGHKALWSDVYNGFPPSDFFKAIDPHLEVLVKRLPGEFVTSDNAVGHLSEEWAEKLGLTTQVVVAAGIMDAHAGAIGAEIRPYEMIKIMGTSTCDIMVAPSEDIKGKPLEGICGQVNGSVLPGLIGLEAGQSAFGDIFNWFASVLSWPLRHILKDQLSSDEMDAQTLHSKILNSLSAEAANLPYDTEAPLTVDWFNGRRTPKADQSLTASINRLNLGSNATIIYKSLVEAACFGAKKINDCFASQGIEIKGITAIGGIAKKSPYVIQTLSNILQLPIKVHKSDKTCAIGAAINASLAAGIFADADTAINQMGQGFSNEYFPDPTLKSYYKERMCLYEKSGAFIESISSTGVDQIAPLPLAPQEECAKSF